MIVEAIFDVLVGFVAGVIGLFPTDYPPSFITDADGMLAQVWAAGAGLGVWIPWHLVGQVVTAVIGCMVVGFTIKIIRLIASIFTGGGGSAA